MLGIFLNFIWILFSNVLFKIVQVKVDKIKLVKQI